jgi:5,10-methylene-tetrahydrofolate dehydrogenase/methenyl tetrahydrofolate cyclohydrolase
MTDWPAYRLIEATAAATIVAVMAGVIAWKGDLDVVVVGALAFVGVFLATLWRNRTSTIHHRSNRPHARAPRR